MLKLVAAQRLWRSYMKRATVAGASKCAAPNPINGCKLSQCGTFGLRFTTLSEGRATCCLL